MRFYNQSFLGSLFSLLLISVILSAGHLLGAYRKDTAVMRFAKQMSARLSEIFVIQWLLIGFLFSVCRAFDLPDLPLEWVIPAGVLITLTTGLILQLWLKRKL